MGEVAIEAVLNLWLSGENGERIPSVGTRKNFKENAAFFRGI